MGMYCCCGVKKREGWGGVLVEKSMNLTEIPESFKIGHRGIILIKRNKDGQEGNAQRRAIKKISSCPEEWDKIVEEFKHLQTTSYQGYRIYASINPRNLLKAVHEFKRRQLDIDFGGEQQFEFFYHDIENSFFSCIMNPSCRTESLFLVDCDTQEEYDKAIEKIPSEIRVFDYPTKNGRHIITKPFNPNLYGVEIKKDSMMYVG